jgi:hypothetical protein
MIRAKNSFSYMDKNLFDTPKGLLRNATGISSYIRTAPKLVAHASFSTTNCLLKLGKASTGVEDIAILSVSKACCATSFHANCFFFDKLVRGLARDP